jgi:LysM repeat protein
MTCRARIVPIGLAWMLLAACQGQAAVSTTVPTETLIAFQTSTATRTATLPVRSDSTSLPLGPTPTPFVHIVQQGETLLGIALRYGVALEDLLLVNPGVDPGFLTIGQQLRIPGSEGEPVDFLLPTPTPFPVMLGPVSCFDSPSGRMVCLLEAENGSASNLEGVAVVVKLFDDRGELIEAKLANSPLDLLLAGGTLPISAAFDERPINFQFAGAEINSAIAVSAEQEDVFPLEVELTEQDLHSGLGAARLAGRVIMPESAPAGTFQVRVAAIARDVSGRPSGYSIWESPPVESGAADLPFSIDVYSLGPALDSVECIAQARRMD